jgi:EAL domain-containing protein (putative c-di-GMP-specific phosphodiesterase class I)
MISDKKAIHEEPYPSDNQFHAVIIGFNKFNDHRLPDLQFAEKDAKDLYDVLVDPDAGNYSPDHIKLITGESNEYDIEAELFALKNKTGTVLVYYSGHGFFVNGISYLGTPNVSLDTIKKNPKAGLRMEEDLYKGVFLETKAQKVIFLLDCCYSGSFFPDILKNKGQVLEAKKLVNEEYFTGHAGRVAFVSSLGKEVSRESTDLRNGIFTYYLIRGIKGAAVERFDSKGAVTMSSLVSYVQARVQESSTVDRKINSTSLAEMEFVEQGQTPVFYGQSTRIVISYPKKALSSDSLEEKHLPASVDKSVKLNPLESPLQGQIECFSKVSIALQNMPKNANANIGDLALKAIQDAFGLDFAFISQLQPDLSPEYSPKFCGLPSQSNMSPANYCRYTLDEMYPYISKEKKELLPVRYGFFKPVGGTKSETTYMAAIPLRIESPREFLFLCGLNENHLKYGEVLGQILHSFYYATRGLNVITEDIKRVEAEILDDIKRVFNRVPHEIYQERKTRFDDRLKTIDFAFEPMLKFGKSKFKISAWEALARDPKIDRAPFDLFVSSELWGAQFITSLDMYCLENAIDSFKKLWEVERKGHEVQTLSVNVYPQTLFRSSYKQLLETIIRTNEDFWDDNLVLEISEKKALISSSDENFANKNVIKEFLSRIDELTKDLHIRFAIDDFGVDNSSIARLIKLELDHVKIDRDILLHEDPGLTLRYVNEVIGKAHHHPGTIIVEGFDEDSHISLPELYKIGISHVQGHLIRRACKTVQDLNESERDYIGKQLTVFN